MPELLVVRGPQGSGKSTLAKRVVPDGYVHVEQDDFFTLGDGTYAYNRDMVWDAVQYCKRIVEEAMRDGNDVVVANVFTYTKQIEWYAAMADAYGYSVTIIDMCTQYGSVHNVPQPVVDKCVQEFEKLGDEGCAGYRITFLS